MDQIQTDNTRAYHTPRNHTQNRNTKDFRYERLMLQKSSGAGQSCTHHVEHPELPEIQNRRTNIPTGDPGSEACCQCSPRLATMNNEPVVADTCAMPCNPVWNERTQYHVPEIINVGRQTTIPTPTMVPKASPIADPPTNHAAQNARPPTSTSAARRMIFASLGLRDPAHTRSSRAKRVSDTSARTNAHDATSKIDTRPDKEPMVAYVPVNGTLPVNHWDTPRSRPNTASPLAAVQPGVVTCVAVDSRPPLEPCDTPPSPPETVSHHRAMSPSAITCSVPPTTGSNSQSGSPAKEELSCAPPESTAVTTTIEPQKEVGDFFNWYFYNSGSEFTQDKIMALMDVYTELRTSQLGLRALVKGGLKQWMTDEAEMEYEIELVGMAAYYRMANQNGMRLYVARGV